MCQVKHRADPAGSETNLITLEIYPDPKNRSTPKVAAERSGAWRRSGKKPVEYLLVKPDYQGFAHPDRRRSQVAGWPQHRLYRLRAGIRKLGDLFTFKRNQSVGCL